MFTPEEEQTFAQYLGTNRYSAIICTSNTQKYDTSRPNSNDLNQCIGTRSLLLQETKLVRYALLQNSHEEKPVHLSGPAGDGHNIRWCAHLSTVPLLPKNRTVRETCLGGRRWRDNRPHMRASLCVCTRKASPACLKTSSVFSRSLLIQLYKHVPSARSFSALARYLACCTAACAVAG